MRCSASMKAGSGRSQASMRRVLGDRSPQVSGTGGHRCLPEMSSALKQRSVIFSTNSVTLGPSHAHPRRRSNTRRGSVPRSSEIFAGRGSGYRRAGSHRSGRRRIEMLPNGRSGTDLEVRSPGKRALYMMKQNLSTSRETPEKTREDLDHNPYVFIVGCSRSGTTLLQRLVDAHPVIAITSQTNWVPRYFEMKTGLTSEGLVTPETIPRLIEYHRFPSLGIDPGDLERLITPSRHASYSSFVSGVFDLYGGTRGKRLAGGKGAAWVRHIPTLHALWPEAKVAHLIRDGRDVCMSILSWRKANRKVGRFTMWTEDPLSTTALWWEWNVRLGRED